MTHAATRELLILRHAKSDWFSGASGDFERPLNERGRQDAPRMGDWLRQRGLVPDQVISSPAERARQTSLAVVEALDIQESHIHWDRRVYMAGVRELLDVLADCPGSARRVLLVGHNPGLEELVVYLADRDSLTLEPGFMKTATLARLSLPKDWRGLKSGSGHLLEWATPKSIQA